MKYLAPLVGLLLLSGCPDVSVRDSRVYKVEIKFMEEASIQQADELASWVKNTCCTPEGQVKDEGSCHKRAKLVQVVKARVPYHRDMMHFLGGITDKRPPKTPPAVPPINDLCGGE